MKHKYAYLVLAVIGFVGPYYFFVAFLTAHGLDGKVFLQELFGTRVSTFFVTDLVVSCVVFVRYLRQEAARYSIKHWWLYIGALLMVGLSFALPLFLYARESAIETRARAAGVS